MRVPTFILEHPLETLIAGLLLFRLSVQADPLETGARLNTLLMIPGNPRYCLKAPDMIGIT